MINLQPLSKEMQNLGIQKFCPFLALHFPLPSQCEWRIFQQDLSGTFSNAAKLGIVNEIISNHMITVTCT